MADGNKDGSIKINAISEYFSMKKLMFNNV